MIHTPFSCVQMMLTEKVQTGRTTPSVCTKIILRGYEISVAMDSSLRKDTEMGFDATLSRSDIRVYLDNKDVSEQFIADGDHMICGTAEELLRVMSEIASK